MFTNMEYVYEVYKEKSFSKAANKMYISQPSLSATVKKIEGRVGSQLFDRSTNPIRLTDCGTEYIKCVEKIMDIENGFENYLNNLNDLKAGNLVIGASNFFASYIIPPIIAKFKKKYPRVSINLIEADTTHLEKQLFSGDIDLIIDNYNFNDTIYKKRLFYSENLLLAVPENFTFNAAAKKHRLSAADIIGDKHLDSSTPSVSIDLLDNTPCILLRHGNDTRDRADKIFLANNFTPNIILELDQLATAYHIACHGMGFTFISDTLVKTIAPDTHIAFYKVDSSHVRRENYFYYKHGKYVSRSMEEFLSIATS